MRDYRQGQAVISVILRHWKFNADEMMVMAMFEQDTAENTKKELEAVLPYVVDDMAVRLLVEQVISKMENLPDEQFMNLELDLYRPDAPEEEKA